jgi:hypothetical protein
MKTSDEAYAEFVADIILTYFTDQLSSGRSVIYESEIWQLLGIEKPTDSPDRKFILKEYENNIIKLDDFRKKPLN